MLTPLLLVALTAAASPAPPDQPTLRCWPESQRDAVITHEKQLVDAASAESLRAFHDLLGSEPHIAGTPGDERTIKRLADAFTSMGLEVSVHTFHPLLAKPTALTLQIIAPDPIDLFVKEDILAEDPFSASPDLLPGWNAYAGNGDVTAEVVYANFGTKADFEKLAQLAIDVRGKIVLARYGGNYRGYKAKFAQAAGAAGLIIYTDPADSGYCKGLVYPEGGFANATCIQRGSIVTLPYVGDPLTPGIEATKDAPRVPIAELDLPKIPVTPVGYAAAQQIIARMKGAAVPAGSGWQGGLPFTYRLTGGPDLKVRLHVEQERFIGQTANVIARLEGVSEPDKLVIIGCHHDAWGHGASDPLAGTITLLESARLLAEAAKNGHRPARTILFCAWGAEEFGIIGSTEWVEANRDDLIKNAVAYINLDMASMGNDFGCSASPPLQQVIADVSRHVPQSGAEHPGTTVFDTWAGRSAPLTDPAFGTLGGGSDHAPFLCHAAIPSAGLAAGGAPGTSYHSTYDTLEWYRRTVGDDYQPALMISRITTLAAHRLATAPIHPLDPAAYPEDAVKHLDALAKRAEQLNWPLARPGAAADARDPATMLVTIRANRVDSLRNAAAAHALKLRQFQSIRERQWPAEGWTTPQLAAWNTAVLRADRAWLDDDGLPNRPWFQNIFVAPDEDSGYASWPLPALRRAVEQKDDEALGEAVEKLEAALERMTAE
jgi:N-acetylated-alpha-linked acidic dipeptidase